MGRGQRLRFNLRKCPFTFAPFHCSWINTSALGWGQHLQRGNWIQIIVYELISQISKAGTCEMISTLQSKGTHRAATGFNDWNEVTYTKNQHDDNDLEWWNELAEKITSSIPTLITNIDWGWEISRWDYYQLLLLLLSSHRHQPSHERSHKMVSCQLWAAKAIGIKLYD